MIVKNRFSLSDSCHTQFLYIGLIELLCLLQQVINIHTQSLRNRFCIRIISKARFPNTKKCSLCFILHHDHLASLRSMYFAPLFCQILHSIFQDNDTYYSQQSLIYPSLSHPMVWDLQEYQFLWNHYWNCNCRMIIKRTMTILSLSPFSV